jgi:hypothetical protein
MPFIAERSSADLWAGDCLVANPIVRPTASRKSKRSCTQGASLCPIPVSYTLRVKPWWRAGAVPWAWRLAAR